MSRALLVLLLLVLTLGMMSSGLPQETVTRTLEGIAAGSTNNIAPIAVFNPTGAAAFGVVVGVSEVSASIRNYRIEPARWDDLEAGQTAEFEFHFDVAADAEPGSTAAVSFDFSSDSWTLKATSAEVVFTILPPEITPESVVMACALTQTTPEQIDPAAAFEHCDDSANRIFLQDRTALFLTPARYVPTDVPGGFAFRVVDPQGDVLSLGYYANEASRVQPRLVKRAAANSPGEFSVILPRISQTVRDAPLAQRQRPQIYTVETSALRFDAGGVLGQGELTGVPVGEWQEEGAFELWDPVLYLQGFVTEQQVEKALGRAFPAGVLRVSLDESGANHIALDLKAEWKPPSDTTSRRVLARLELEFPEALFPNDTTMGEIGAKFENIEHSDGPTYRALFFTAGINLLVPASVPGRNLVEGGSVPTPWATAVQMGRISGLESFVQAQDEPATLRPESPTRFDGKIRLMRPRGNANHGLPARSLSAHLRDLNTIWVVPVFYHLSVETSSNFKRHPFIKNWGYAIYKAEAGRYAGPIPEGDTGPESDTSIADAGPEAQPDTGVTVPSLIGRSSSDAIESLRAAGLVAAPRLGTPAPSAELAGTVSLQSPAESTLAPPGSRVEIEIYGPYQDARTVPSLVGRTAAAAQTLIGQAGLTPRLRIGGPAPSAALAGVISSQHPPASATAKPGSVVEAVVYGPYTQLAKVPTVVGFTAAEAKDRIEGAGLRAEIRVVAASSARQAERVTAQVPVAGMSVTAGGSVTVSVAGPFVEMVSVPDLSGLSSVEARARLGRVGLAADFGFASAGGVVKAQGPVAGARVARGSSVRVEFSAAVSPITPARPVPPIPAPVGRLWRLLGHDLASSPQELDTYGSTVYERFYAATEDGLSGRFRLLRGATVGKDVSWQVAVTRPPSAIQHGDSFEIRLNGSLTSRAGPFAESWYVTARIESVGGGQGAVLASKTIALTNGRQSQNETLKLELTDRTPDRFIVRVYLGTQKPEQSKASIWWEYGRP